MPDMNRKIFDWSKVKSWVSDTFSLNTHDHDDRYSKLGHTHTDAIYGTMPDFSRAVSVGVQEGWKSTTKECYNEPGLNNNVHNGGCPFVLKLVTPCYLYLSFNGTSFDDDGEWALWFGPNRNNVICCNKADDHAYRSVMKRLTAENGFSGVVMGTNLFIILQGNSGEGDDCANFPVPMSTVGWWYRPMIGGGGSDNENWEHWDFKLVPCVNTPKGTLLVERYQFTADNSKSSLLNTNPVYGTMSGNNNIITYYNNNDTSKATASITRTRPGKIYAK